MMLNVVLCELELNDNKTQAIANHKAIIHLLKYHSKGGGFEKK